MDNTFHLGHLAGWLFGSLVFAIGMLNIIMVHPVPGVVYLLLSFLYFPPANSIFKKRFGLEIPSLIKITLGIVIIMFTLGVSDLGDIIDKL